MTSMTRRYRQTFSDALQALPLMQQGDGLGWDPSTSLWRIYALSDGTETLEPELIRVANRLVSVSWTGTEILKALDQKKSLH